MTIKAQEKENGMGNEEGKGGNSGMGLLSGGALALFVAQFFSAFADNALLIGAVALLKAAGDGARAPVLQELFVIPFILLAPFAGPLADRFPKSFVMMVGNFIKLAGASALLLGASPFVSYGVVGVGACLYSPAKYGILAQMFAPKDMVRANGMMEGSTIAAILLGVVAGGILSDISPSACAVAVCAAYFVAFLSNLAIPRLSAENPESRLSPARLVPEFLLSLKTLFMDKAARASLLGTGSFWGAGATLRLAVFAWVPIALGSDSNQLPSNLMGAVSVGIVAGAALAAATVGLQNVGRAFAGGLLLGPCVAALSLSGSLWTAVPILVAIGVAGGFFAIPLNALLQERGHGSVGAGRALAVQNMVENLCILAFMGAYYVLVPGTIGVVAFCAWAGAFLTLAMAVLARSSKGLAGGGGHGV